LLRDRRGAATISADKGPTDVLIGGFAIGLLPKAKRHAILVYTNEEVDNAYHYRNAPGFLLGVLDFRVRGLVVRWPLLDDSPPNERITEGSTFNA
jgi:hypothetical protein